MKIQHVTHYCFIVSILVPAVVQCISVVGPRVLRPFSPYKVAVAGGSRAYTLYIAIEGRKSTGEQFSQGREVQISIAHSRIFDLDIGDPGPGQYALVARSTSGPQFSSSSPLVYQPRSFCVFVQTDKRVYQPEDTINFRVIALDKYLLPLNSTVDISILDAGGSEVRQWAGISLVQGIFSSELILADEPALGEWTIQVEARGQKYSQHMLIADYVRPKFQMDMEIPKEVLFTTGRFNVNVTAKHFNGLPVRGELTVSVYAVFFSGLLQPVFSSASRKVIAFDGQADVTYDLKTDLDLAEDAARPLVIEAVLEEKDTLIKQNISSRILVLRTPHRLKVSAPDYFKPELPYVVQIETVDPLGKSMEADGDVKVEQLWDDGIPAKVTTVPLKKGFATYTLTPDIAHTSSTLNLAFSYKDATERVVNVQSCASSGDQYLTIEILTRRTSVGDEMRARISATEPMDLLHYVVIGRGDILVAETIELAPARRSVDVSVAVTTEMSPGCVLLAWYTRLDTIVNSLLSSAIYIPQNKLLKHEVAVSVGGGSYRPGGAVEFRVSGEPGAHAGLLAEDARAAAAGLAAADGLGAGFNMYTVKREVERFNSLKHTLFKNEDHLPGMGLDLGGNTTNEVFENAGVIILTDGFVSESTSKGDSSDENVPETGTRPPLAGPYAFSRLPPPPAPRYYLTITPQPTWMLANFSLGSDGRGVENRRSPISAAEWLVGAFAVHPTLGLGLASPQTLTTSFPLAMSAELPETLQRGESIAAVITLKSTLTVDTSVEITFHNSDQYFEFGPLDNNIDSSKKIETFRRERVTVPARGSVSTAFLVTTVRAGETPVIVEATGNGISASLFRTIDVKDGYEEEIWSWDLLDARTAVARVNVSLEPMPGTKLGQVSLLAAGDILAGAIQASRSPPGLAADPPTALRPLAVACVLLDYLQARGRDEVAIGREARAQAAAGYQRLMAYRRPDGSFAANIDPDSVGDVWMTAVATRWLSRASRYVSVSPSAAAAGARWLAGAQLLAGGWRAPPPPDRNDQRAQSPLPLAAHALLALLQVQGGEYLYKDAINKALDYVARGVSEGSATDAYSAAIAGAALAAARHPHASAAIQLLDQYANGTGSMVYWSRQLPPGEWRNPWLRGNSVRAATGAWALRAILEARTQTAAAAPRVARALLASLPPTADRLDPDVLDSLAQFAETIKTSNKLRLSVNVTGLEEPRQFTIDEDNAIIVQTQLVRNARSAVAVSEGRGVAAVGLSARGSTNVTAPWPRYTLDPRVDHVSTAYRLQLSICIGFVAQGNETESGLALLTVQLPSGYLADINTITELTSSRLVSAARLQRGGARVVAKVRAVRAERCATLAAPRALPVASQRAGYATVEDLYDSSHRARVFFHPIQSHACDICRDWNSCSKACGSLAKRQGTDGRGTDGGTSAPDHATMSQLAPAVAFLATIAIILR